MSNNQNAYINDYNQKNYKLYQFRVRKENTNLIQHLDTLPNRNGLIVEKNMKEDLIKLC